MKTSASKLLVLASLAALASFGARADEADASQFGVQFSGTRSRAEVQAELAQFKTAGTSPWSIQYNPLAQFKSVLTRADVRAEYIAQRDQVAALNGEDSGSAYLAQARHSVGATTTLAGQPVRAE
jgi:hypothetical protein